MRLLKTVIFVVALALMACGDDDETNDTNNDNQVAATIEASIEAHQKYSDVAVALEDGYVSTDEYVVNPETGAAMGIHFVNFDIQGVDPDQANVLLYDVAEDGTYELIAVEWLVPSDAVEEAPQLFGQTFEGPMPGHGPEEPEHYELHAWFFRDNPDGMFAGFNPDLAPPNWWGELETTMESIADYQDVADAEAAGYVSTGECVEMPMEGGMGVHYVNDTVMGVSPDAPNVLMYGDDGSGNMVLLGVEWLVPEMAVNEAPELFDQTFEGPMPGHEEGQPDHYELHVWTHKANPDGYFSGFNPDVSCPSM